MGQCYRRDPSSKWLRISRQGVGAAVEVWCRCDYGGYTPAVLIVSQINPISTSPRFRSAWSAVAVVLERNHGEAGIILA